MHIRGRAGWHWLGIGQERIRCFRPSVLRYCAVPSLRGAQALGMGGSLSSSSLMWSRLNVSSAGESEPALGLGGGTHSLGWYRCRSCSNWYIGWCDIMISTRQKMGMGKTSLCGVSHTLLQNWGQDIICNGASSTSIRSNCSTRHRELGLLWKASR